MTAAQVSVDSVDMSAFLSSHQRLVFDPFNDEVPQSIVFAMREAATFGEVFAERLPTFDSKPKAEFDASLCDELRLRLGKFDGPSCKLLVKIAFLVRATESLRDALTENVHGYKVHSLGIMAQHAITEAKLRLSPGIMRQLWQDHDVVGVDEVQWRKTLSGGYRVARLAEQLGFDGFGWPRPVYLPTVDEDRAKIDLLVANGLGQGMAIQAKSCEAEGIRLFRILEEPCGGVLRIQELGPHQPPGHPATDEGSEQAPEPEKPDYSLCRALWLSTQKFNAHYALNWGSVVAFVGKRG